MNEKEEIIGTVTSGAFCPSLDCAAALCSIDAEIPCAFGDTLLLDAGNVKLPGVGDGAALHRNGSLRSEV